MTISVEQIGNDWIAYAQYPSPADHAPEQVTANSYDLGWLVEDQPEKARETIQYIVYRYSQDEILGGQETEARRVVGLLAAGPLEDFLAAYGRDFVERVEAEAGRDQRMAWALGGVWQFTMPDDAWDRVPA